MKKRINIIITLFILIPLVIRCNSNTSTDNGTHYLGILEGNGKMDKARVLFFRKNDTWHPLSNLDDLQELDTERKKYPTSVDWSVIYKGKKLGEVISQKEKEGWDKTSELGSQNIEEFNTKKYKIPKESPRYSSWTGEEKYMLLLMSSAHLKKIDIGWEITEEQFKSDFLKFFKSKNPTIPKCDNQGFDNENFRRIDYEDESVEIIQTYEISNNDILMGMKINNSLNTCDGPPGKEWFPHWFIKRKSGKIEFVGKNVYPVDSLTFSKNKTVWLFKESGYNRDGYVLYYDNFKRSATFNWFYH